MVDCYISKSHPKITKGAWYISALTFAIIEASISVLTSFIADIWPGSKVLPCSHKLMAKKGIVQERAMCVEKMIGIMPVRYGMTHILPRTVV